MYLARCLRFVNIISGIINMCKIGLVQAFGTASTCAKSKDEEPASSAMYCVFSHCAATLLLQPYYRLEQESIYYTDSGHNNKCYEYQLQSEKWRVQCKSVKHQTVLLPISSKQRKIKCLQDWVCNANLFICRPALMHHFPQTIVQLGIALLQWTNDCFHVKETR
jgi:hypothetical protein